MSRTSRAPRRADALSRDRIVEAAIEILDTDGEGALTFRALTTRLSTGAGAIYHHVANKDELLAAATDGVIAGALAGRDAGEPREAVRGVALAVFDAIDGHPWVGTQLSREPWQPAVLRIFEGIGGRLGVLGVAEAAQFDTTTALLSYILGLAGQYAAAARLLEPGTDREEYLSAIADRWGRLDPVVYPFVHRMAAQLSTHDDREQFLAGVDLILAGIDTLR
ncbi:TetR/AcrR family transcriptional regulator [Tsukamurella soli]|uniref:TetR family transcriptional regulator n=1 Tax=Tsukamurella soli TaxID=644556 RepID=A0ABP8JLE6_9ACTN